MAKRHPDSKSEELRRRYSLNPRPERVTDPYFTEDAFFDPRDMMQVKYEMLRRVRVDEQSIQQASSAFGLSRPAYYRAQSAFDREGVAGLLPKKRGPRHRHKLSAEVVSYLEEVLVQQGRFSSQALVTRVFERFGIRVHKRSIERALAASKKKRR